ncbi:MAG: sulfotransferase [Chitinophagaceae bacterium]|nr:sulfotransferase [Chitinophagaceae bacterium]
MWTKVIRYFRLLLTSVPNPEKWVFIAGCPNSGTTLLHEILAQHPAIGSMPEEGQFCTDQLISPYSLGVSRVWMQKIDFFYLNDETGSSKININKLKRQWALHYDDVSKPILIEKSPTNAVRLRWLQKHFSKSYFIGIYRNGYAVSKGIAGKTGCPLEDAVLQWKGSNEIMLEDFAHLHRKLMISYEELTEQPVETMLKIASFLSITPLPNEQVRQSYTIHGIERTIENLNKQTIAKLQSDEIDMINEQASALLHKLNYKILSSDLL